MDAETYVFQPGDVRRLSWRSRLVQLRQSARQAYDLMYLGHGTVERLCAALVLAAAFSFVGFIVAVLVARVGPAYALVLAGGVLVVVFLPGAFLVLGPSDEELEGRRAVLSEHLAEAYVAQEALDQEEEEWARARAEQEALETEARAGARRRPPPPPRPRTRHCLYCDEEILARAVKCKHCGELLDERLRRKRVREGRPQWSPGVAAVLSFFIPGLGQMYKGQVFSGCAWLVVVPVGYLLCVVPGLVFHLLCIIEAGSEDPYPH
jgi:hypothetical protein